MGEFVKTRTIHLALGPYPDAAELRDGRVTGSRPAADGLVDIDLLGHRQGDDGGWAEPGYPECPLTVWWPSEQTAGTCLGVANVYHRIPHDWPPGRSPRRWCWSEPPTWPSTAPTAPPRPERS